MDAVMERGAAAPAQAVAVAAPADTKLDLRRIDLTDVALAQFGPWGEDVGMVRTMLTGVVYDLSTQAKVDEAKSRRHTLIGKPRAEVRRVSKDLKSKLAQVSKAIGAEEAKAVAAYDDVETLITPQIEAAQSLLDAERERLREVERARVAEREQRLVQIAGYVKLADGRKAAEIAAGISYVEAIALDAAWWNDDFIERAKEVKASALASLTQLHAAAAAREAEAARVEAQRIENERRERELAEQRAAVEREQNALKALMSELQGLQQQPIVARTGRLGVRAGGTLQCALDTLAETERWELPAERWGDMLPLAQATKARAVAEIRAIVAEVEHEQEAQAARSSAAATPAAVAGADVSPVSDAGMAETPAREREAAPFTLRAEEEGGSPADAPAAVDAPRSNAGNEPAMAEGSPSGEGAAAAQAEVGAADPEPAANDDAAEAARVAAALSAFSIVDDEQDSQRQASEALTDPNATGNGSMARNTDDAAPVGGPAEGAAVASAAAAPGSLSDDRDAQGAPITGGADKAPTLSLGDLCVRYGAGFSMTRHFVEAVLGVPASGLSPRKTPLWSKHDERALAAALSALANRIVRGAS